MVLWYYREKRQSIFAIDIKFLKEGYAHPESGLCGKSALNEWVDGDYIKPRRQMRSGRCLWLIKSPFPYWHRNVF